MGQFFKVALFIMQFSKVLGRLEMSEHDHVSFRKMSTNQNLFRRNENHWIDIFMIS